jgi:hypothetical protein
MNEPGVREEQPFALSLSKGFDKLSPNGLFLESLSR